MPARILIADALPVVREGLKKMLAPCVDILVVAEAATGLEAERISLSMPLDLIVVDVALADLSGFEVVRGLRSRGSAVPAVLFSQQHAEQYAVLASRCGAQGILTKTLSSASLITALRKVLAGGRCFPDSNLEGADHASVLGPFDRLSRREREVMTALLAGEPAAALAARLNVSTKTVATYRERLMQKIGVQSVAELAIVATRYGIV